MKFHRPVLLTLAAALLLLAGYGLFPSKGGEPSTDRSVSSGLPPATTTQTTPLLQTLAEAAASKPAPVSAIPLIGIGMTTQEPLAFVTKYRSQGGPGAFAMAEQVTVACREALGALDYFNNPSNGAEIAGQLAKRGIASGRSQSLQLQAAQSLESRCRPFENPLESDDPKADDASGKAYLAAQAELLKSIRGSSAALQEIAAQGQLQAASVALRGRFRLPDESNASPEDREILMRGITLAAFRASTDTSHEASDLRVMTECLRTGVCDGSYESVMFQYWPEGSPQRARILAISKRVEKAFADNDPKLFDGKSSRP